VSSRWRAVPALAGLAVLLVLPFYLDTSWLRTGLFALAAAVAASATRSSSRSAPTGTRSSPPARPLWTVAGWAG